MSKLAQYLPHDVPMVLIDKLIQYDDSSITVQAIIKDKYPFTNGTIGSWIGLEFMAQAAGVFAALHRKNASGNINLGFLLGSRNFISHTPTFTPGETVTISVSTEFTSDNGLSAATGIILNDQERVLCEASLTLYQDHNGTFSLDNEKP